MSESQPGKKTSRLELTLAAVVAAAALGVLGFQYYRVEIVGPGNRGPMERRSFVLVTDDGRQMLWGGGNYNLEEGEWFDVTDAPIEPNEYQFGIGKDTIPAIDDPQFVPIGDAERLKEVYGIFDFSEVIGFVHNGQAKAYPTYTMNQHELVNDVIGGKPVTVGW